MLTAEQNDELTQVAAGTPMGELLRRYWYPVVFTRALEEFPVQPARLLGEDFAVFKTPRGKYGILPEGCPHRRASLAYGVVEADGLRCPYHGWLFGTDGSCLDQPAEREETNFRDRVRAAAGVAQELGGLVWAYIGPSPAPQLPRFDVFVMNGCGASARTPGPRRLRHGHRRPPAERQPERLPLPPAAVPSRARRAGVLPLRRRRCEKSPVGHCPRIALPTTAVHSVKSPAGSNSRGCVRSRSSARA